MFDINEEEIRETIAEWCRSTPLCPKEFAYRMDATFLAGECAVYWVNTRYEVRKRELAKPMRYSLEPQDDYDPIDIWDVLVDPRSFGPEADRVVRLPLPGSVHQKQCGHCAGGGQMVCRSCKGRGNFPCAARSCHLGKCTRCRGTGRVKCRYCLGEGSLTCPQCAGEGFLPLQSAGGNREPCSECSRSGRQPCTCYATEGRQACAECDGSGACGGCHGVGLMPCKDCVDGRTVCAVCSGNGRIIGSFEVVISRFTEAVGPIVLNRFGLPDTLLLQTPEVLQAAVRATYYAPPDGDLQDLPDEPAVVAAIEAGWGRASFESRPLQQQVVSCRLPIVRVDYTYSGSRRRTLWIYSRERRIHAPERPVSIFGMGR